MECSEKRDDLVGSRPDISGHCDFLAGEYRKLLALKTGITHEASIKYQKEETFLDQKENPLDYNDTGTFPHKMRMTVEYIYNRSFHVYVGIIVKTLFK